MKYPDYCPVTMEFQILSGFFLRVNAGGVLVSYDFFPTLARSSTRFQSSHTPPRSSLLLRENVLASDCHNQYHAVMMSDRRFRVHFLALLISTPDSPHKTRRRMSDESRLVWGWGCRCLCLEATVVLARSILGTFLAALVSFSVVLKLERSSCRNVQ